MPDNRVEELEEIIADWECQDIPNRKLAEAILQSGYRKESVDGEMVEAAKNLIRYLDLEGYCIKGKGTGEYIRKMNEALSRAEGLPVRDAFEGIKIDCAELDKIDYEWMKLCEEDCNAAPDYQKYLNKPENKKKILKVKSL